MLANRSWTGSLVSAIRSRLFWVKNLFVCFFVVLARWTLENDQTYDLLDTLIQYLLISLRLRHFSVDVRALEIF